MVAADYVALVTGCLTASSKKKKCLVEPAAYEQEEQNLRSL